jgi:hypothetical protein
VGDADGNANTKEILYVSGVQAIGGINSQLNALYSNGSEIPGWPKFGPPRQHPNMDWEYTTPRATSLGFADVNQDGIGDMIGFPFSMGWNTITSYEDVFDINGESLSGFPLWDSETPREMKGYFDSFADVDRDGFLELMGLSDQHLLTLYNHDGSLVCGWPKRVQQYRMEQPRGDRRWLVWYGDLFGDLDNDGSVETLRPVGSTSRWLNPSVIYIINLDSYEGEEDIFYIDVPPAVSPSEYDPLRDPSPAFPVSFTLGDVDGDSEAEIIAVYSRYTIESLISIANDIELLDVYAFNPDGTLVAGWPISIPGLERGSVRVGSTYLFSYPLANSFSRNMITGDVDGDGIAEIIFGVENVLYAWKGDGTLVAGWPVFTDSAILEISIGDLDNDGMAEVAAGTKGGGLFIWDTEGIFNENTIEWPMKGHDTDNSNCYNCELAQTQQPEIDAEECTYYDDRIVTIEDPEGDTLCGETTESDVLDIVGVRITPKPWELDFEITVKGDENGEIPLPTLEDNISYGFVFNIYHPLGNRVSNGVRYTRGKIKIGKLWYGDVGFLFCRSETFPWAVGSAGCVDADINGNVISFTERLVVPSSPAKVVISTDEYFINARTGRWDTLTVDKAVGAFGELPSTECNVAGNCPPYFVSDPEGDLISRGLEEHEDSLDIIGATLYYGPESVDVTIELKGDENGEIPLPPGNGSYCDMKKGLITDDYNYYAYSVTWGRHGAGLMLDSSGIICKPNSLIIHCENPRIEGNTISFTYTKAADATEPISFATYWIELRNGTQYSRQGDGTGWQVPEPGVELSPPSLSFFGKLKGLVS